MGKYGRYLAAKSCWLLVSTEYFATACDFSLHKIKPMVGLSSWLMTPAQFERQCLLNWIGHIKKAHIA